jgi:hypothetical protein
MPGYHPPKPVEEQGADDMPRGGPAEPPDEGADEGADGGPVDEHEGGEVWTTPPEKRPPPPVYRPPEPEPQVATPDPGSRTAPQAPPQPSGGVRVVQLDADSAYIIDEARNLCFFRFREALTAVDCARVAGASQPAPTQPQPPAPNPPARVQPAPEPAPVPVRPEPTPGAFRPDEIERFQRAFNQIFCDRVAKSNVAPEQRIREAGLDEARYEAIETWMADDDKRWWDATDKARNSCKPTR